MMIIVTALASLMMSTADLDTLCEEPVAVRKFSLVTESGENILHKDFDRRRLADGLDRLSLVFHAANYDVRIFM